MVSTARLVEELVIQDPANQMDRSLPQTQLQQSAQQAWERVRSGVRLPGSDWSLVELARREDRETARVVYRAEASTGLQFLLKHQLRPWEPTEFKKAFDRHKEIWESFPATDTVAVAKPVYLDHEHQASLAEYAPGEDLLAHMKAAVDDSARLKLVETAGQWLDAFHRSRPYRRHRFEPHWTINRFLDLRSQIESGARSVPAQGEFLRGIAALFRLGPEVAGKETISCSLHGDFHLGNLIWNGRRMTGVDFVSNRWTAAVGHDIGKFLIDVVRRYYPASEITPGGVIPERLLAAFFRGYRLVDQNDPSVRLLALAQLLEAWLLVPKSRWERTPAKQQCLEQVRPIASRAFLPSSSAPGGDLRFLLTERTVALARRGGHAFIAELSAAAEHLGFQSHYLLNTEVARRQAIADNAWTVFHMDNPLDRHSFCFRKAYVEPFWQLEQSAARWNWDVALRPFDAQSVRRDESDRFYEHWRERLYPEVSPEAGEEPFVYIPLQGRLLEHRSFQSCSPIEMVRSTLNYSPLPIRATLHPAESYSDRERRALKEIESDFPRFRVVELPMQSALGSCQFVVTQNSSVGFHAIFFRKPVILFAKIDFHHICLNVNQIGVAEAFLRIHGFAPDYAGYLYWFLRENAIDVARPDCREGLTRRLAGFGMEAPPGINAR